MTNINGGILTVLWTFSSMLLQQWQQQQQQKIGKHTPIKIKSNKLFTLNDKPWISRAIRKSIKTRNKIYKHYCKEKRSSKKEFLHERFKIYRNRMAASTKI